MSYQICEPGHLCPISILLTTSGSRGYKLLFHYPKSKETSLNELFERTSETMARTPNKKCGSSSSLEAFTLQLSDEGVRTSINHEIMDASINSLKPTSYIENDKLSSDLKEDILVSLLAVRNNFSKEKFYLKVEDVIFVGNLCGTSKFSIGVIDEDQTIRTFNVVFAIRSTAPKTVQDSFYILAKAIASAICLEEKRCRFLSEERTIIQNVFDDLQEQSDNGQNPSNLLFEKSQLCRDLKKIVDDVSMSGMVFSKINNLVMLCHCIPQRIYHVIDNVYINSVAVTYAANNIKPYHTLVLLSNKDEILDSLPIYNPDSKKFIVHISLKETIYDISVKYNLSLNFCLKMAGSLVLWGKAIISYPIYDFNVYWIAPFADICLSFELLEDFHNIFPALFLPKVFQQINAYVPYGDIIRNLSIDEDTGLQLIEWLMYNRLIYQFHKYFTLIQCDRRNYYDFSKITGLSSSLKQNDETTNMFTQLCMEYPMLCSDTCNLDTSFGPDSIKLFSKILPLCNGEHHLEDIAFQLYESRSDIVQCMEQFNNVLITIETADPITSCFVGIN